MLCDTLDAQYLFVDGDRVYLRVFEPIGPRDSLWVPGLGTVVETDPPIVKLAVSTYFVRLQMGAKVRLLRTVLRRRAADVSLVCDPGVWDPLTIQSGSAFAAAGLFHRGVFRLTDDQGGVEGDLARDWFWKGFDLFVVVDTTARFGDGTRVDAYSVKSSVERYLWYRRDVPEFSWQYSITGIEAYRSGRTDQVLGLIPRSRDTLQFNMARPLYDLPGYLALPELAIVRWRQEEGAAPVIATAGYYGLRTADTIFGRAPSYGRIRLTVPEHSATASAVVLHHDRPDSQRVRATLFHDCPVPQLLVVRARSNLGRQLLPFVRFAIDREGLRNAAGEPAFPCTESLFPDPTRDTSGRRDVISPDLMRAQQARQLVRGAPRVRISGWGSRSAIGTYLVDAFKAWNLKGSLVDSLQECDLRVERWDFGHFFSPLYAEVALMYLQGMPDDSLLGLLASARQISDDSLRRAAYQSLLVRIADESPYVATLQFGTTIETDVAELAENLFYKEDWLGRPAGPIFAPGEEP